MKENIYFLLALLLSNLTLSKLKDVSTPLQKKRIEFHLFNARVHDSSLLN
jgi:hypothetical protein